MKTLILAMALSISYTAMACDHAAQAPKKPAKERSVAGKKSAKENKNYLDGLRSRMSGMSNKTRI